ncbi:MAG: TetR/AcrR family transcriptional regulator [Polyangiaceae bacterium]
MAPKKPPVPAKSLSAEDWEVAALEALAERGMEGVAVQPLARRLQVTKGSFYWHFADRDALLKAALARWEQGHTERVIDLVSAESDPRERLKKLLGLVLVGRGDRIYIALAASDEPAVRAALARVAKRRIRYLEECFIALGERGASAARSALLAYTVYVGLVHLRLEAPRELPTRDAMPEQIDHILERLLR